MSWSAAELLVLFFSIAPASKSNPTNPVERISDLP
jgi:hypothetical protein